MKFLKLCPLIFSLFVDSKSEGGGLWVVCHGVGRIGFWNMKLGYCVDGNLVLEVYTLEEKWSEWVVFRVMW